MKLKTRENVRNTRYGEGYTSAEIGILTIANLAGLSQEEIDILTEDAGVKKINPSTANLNGRKMENLLQALSDRVITVGEFQEELRGELDRTDAKFDSIIV